MKPSHQQPERATLLALVQKAWETIFTDGIFMGLTMITIVATVGWALVVPGIRSYIKKHNTPPQNVGSVFTVQPPCSAEMATGSASNYSKEGYTTSTSSCSVDADGTTINYGITSYLATTGGDSVRGVYENDCAADGGYTGQNGTQVAYVNQASTTFNGITFNTCEIQEGSTVGEVRAYGIDSTGQKLAAIDITLGALGDSVPTAHDLDQRLADVLKTIQFN